MVDVSHLLSYFQLYRSAASLITVEMLLNSFVTAALLVVVAAHNCRLREPIDLARTLQPDSIGVTVPFTPGNLTEGEEAHGIRFRINDFCVGEHTGTHLDAPFHFNANGWKVADIPLGRLIANGVFMNFSKETNGDIAFRLEPQHIDRWIAQNGPLPPNAILLISYGWAQLYSNRTAYTGTTSTEFFDFQYPGMSVSTARKLANMDEVVGIGVDTVSADASGTGEAHYELTAKNIYILESLDMDQPCLPARGFKVYSMPMKLRDGTGAPARVIVVPNDDFWSYF